jgi:hypothetical protein
MNMEYNKYRKVTGIEMKFDFVIRLFSYLIGWISFPAPHRGETPLARNMEINIDKDIDIHWLGCAFSTTTILPTEGAPVKGVFHQTQLVLIKKIIAALLWEE